MKRNNFDQDRFSYQAAAVFDYLSHKDIVHFQSDNVEQVKAWVCLENGEPYTSFLRSQVTTTSSILELFITLELFKDGMKRVYVDQLIAEALEHTNLNILWEEYRQPFKTMGVVLPEGYFLNRQVGCPQAGEYLTPAWKAPERHYPILVEIHHDGDLNFMILSVYFTSRQTTNFIIKLGCQKELMTIDEYIKFSMGKTFDNSNEECTPEEFDISYKAICIALNTFLLMEYEGMRRVGHQDEEKYQDLRKYIKTAEMNKKQGRRIDPDRLEEAKLNIKLCPVVYDFDSNVKVYDHEIQQASNPPSGEPTGRQVAPHWRAGHWQTYLIGHGPDKKKIRKRKKSVLVNAHLFKGKMIDARASYSFATKS